MTKIVCLVLVFIGSMSLIAQDRMTPELLWDLKRVGDPKISPNGTQLFYSVKEYDLATNSSVSDLWVGDINGLPAKQITRTPASEMDAQWSNDGSKILYLANTDSGINLFEMSWNGRDIKQISNVEGGMGGFKISPDGSKILFIQDVKMNAVSAKEMYEVKPDDAICPAA